MIPRLESVAALAEPATLGRWAAGTAAVHRHPLPSLGFSSAEIERLEAVREDGHRFTFILKRSRPAEDWIACRTRDAVGREAALLAEPALAAVWEVFSCPYLAYASREGETGLLMRDLAPHLLPDLRAPLAEAEEERLLTALASLHARFWSSDALDLPWLAQPVDFYGLLGPRAGHDDPLPLPHDSLLERVQQGWAIALSRLPPGVTRLLEKPPEEVAERCAGLPRTLLHGDAKVANFALLPEGRVAAFDWAMVGVGPSALELGWYLAVNSSRLTGSKEQAMQRYRQSLEKALHASLPETTWSRMVEVAVLSGAMMLLWSKALGMQSGAPHAQRDWEWYSARLAAM